MERVRKFDCWVCGNNQFNLHMVLWDDLIEQWQLSATEVEYVNRQQGMVCSVCGNNLRSIALAKAIMDSCGYDGIFSDFISTEGSKKLRVLEINEAGGLSKYLQMMPGHHFISYPDCDMHNLGLPSQSFDLVVHSDTLEHIQFPIIGLKECRRILNDTGRCIYTVPIIVGRLSRSRDGMEPSFHGSSTEAGQDLLVWTEFGADFWKFPLEAGFSRVAVHSLEYPAALAIEAKY